MQYCDTESGCRVKTFDPLSGKQLRELKLNRTDSDALRGASSGSAFVSPTGRFFVSFSAGNPKVSGVSKFRVGRSMTMPTGFMQPYTIKGTDVQTGRKIWEIKAQSDSMKDAPALTFSPADTTVAVATIDKGRWSVQLCDTSSGRVLRSIDAGERPVMGDGLQPRQ